MSSQALEPFNPPPLRSDELSLDEDDESRGNSQLASGSDSQPSSQELNTLGRRLQGRSKLPHDLRRELRNLVRDPLGLDEPVDAEDAPVINVADDDLAATVSDLAQEIDFDAIENILGWDGNEMVRALRYGGYIGLANKVWDEMVAEGRSLPQRCPKDIFIETTMKMFASMSPKLLIHLMLGDLHHLMHTDLDLDANNRLLAFCYQQKSLPANQRTRLPCVYWQVILDDNHKSLTWRELDQLANDMQRYLTDDDFAFQVDGVRNPHRKPENQWTRRQSEQGKRFYIATKDTATSGGAYVRDPNHVDKVNAFYKYMKQRVAKIPLNRRDEESTPPLSEIGYSGTPHDRLPIHQNHQSGANRLLVLSEAILQAKKTCYTNNQHIIYVSWEPLQGVVSEPVFTVLARAYVETGSGCNTYEAGQNNPVNRVDDARWEELFKQNCRPHSAFHKNIMAEHRRLKAHIDEVNKLEAEEAQLDREIDETERATAYELTHTIFHEQELDDVIQRGESAVSILQAAQRRVRGRQ